MDLSENQVSIVDVSARGGGAEGQDRADSERVFGQASFEEMGMDLLEVFHGGAVFFQYGEVWMV